MTYLTSLKILFFSWFQYCFSFLLLGGFGAIIWRFLFSLWRRIQWPEIPCYELFPELLFEKIRDFWLQYFICLPIKISSSEFHSIRKMISASRRIFFEKILYFRPQYFICLPIKISSSEFHSIRKMISASRRIFFEQILNLNIFNDCSYDSCLPKG